MWNMCSIIQCFAKKNTNLTYYYLPTNEELRRKWIDVIGIENLKPGIKTHRICSIHFEEGWFKRTLDMIRRREHAVPTVNYGVTNEAQGPVPTKIERVEEEANSGRYRPPIFKEQDPLRIENDSDATVSDLDEPSSPKSLDDLDATVSDSHIPSSSKPLSSNKTNMPVRSKTKSVGVQPLSTKNQAPTMKELNPIRIIESTNKTHMPVQSKMKNVGVRASSTKNQTLTMKEVARICVESSKVTHMPVRLQASSTKNQAPTVKDTGPIRIEDDSDVSDLEMPSPPKALSSKKPQIPMIKITSVRTLATKNQASFPVLELDPTRASFPVIELDPTQSKNDSDSDLEVPSPSKPLSSKNTHIPVRKKIKSVGVQASSTKNQASRVKEDTICIENNSNAMASDEEMPSSSQPLTAFKPTNEVEMPSSTVPFQLLPPTKFTRMQEVCVRQRKKIKVLNTKIYRQTKKIAKMQEIIDDLKIKLKEHQKIVIVVV